MRLLLLLGLFVLLCGPLRPWGKRHWALLLSVFAGGVLGVLAAGWIMAATRQWYPGLVPLFAVLGAVAVGQVGPEFLRHLQEDGRDHERAKRH